MKILLATLAAVVLTANVYAAPQEEDPDTIILSDTLHYDDVSKTSTFTGNVILTRGAMTLRSEKLVTHEDKDGNQYGKATAPKGQIVTINQENPEKFETIVGTGQQADYNGADGTVILTGHAIVTRKICGQAFDNVRGAKIIYHEKTAKYEAFGGPESAGANGRVRSLTQPQSRVDKAVEKCKASKS